MIRMLPMGAALLIAAPAIGQTQSDMNREAGGAFARADAAMNAQYRVTMAAMKRLDALHEPDATTGPSYQNALLASQRAWIAFRDTECVIEGYEFRGGSAQGMATVQCRAELTKARIQQLKAMTER